MDLALTSDVYIPNLTENGYTDKIPERSKFPIKCECTGRIYKKSCFVQHIKTIVHKEWLASLKHENLLERSIKDAEVIRNQQIIIIKLENEKIFLQNEIDRLGIEINKLKKKIN